MICRYEQICTYKHIIKFFVDYQNYFKSCICSQFKVLGPNYFICLFTMTSVQ